MTHGLVENLQIHLYDTVENGHNFALVSGAFEEFFNFKSLTFDCIFLDPCGDVEGQVFSIKGAGGETGQYGSWSTTVQS